MIEIFRAARVLGDRHLGYEQAYLVDMSVALVYAADLGARLEAWLAASDMARVSKQAFGH